jgi:hypothetical protein
MRPSRIPSLAIVCFAIGCAGTLPFAQDTPLTQEARIEKLVETINYNADPLHGDYTPSVHELIEIGDPAIPRVLDLMLLDGPHDKWTRLHAERVLNGIILKDEGFIFGKGWTDGRGKERAHALFVSHGSLDYEAPLQERERAVQLWREWFATKNEQKTICEDPAK